MQCFIYNIFCLPRTLCIIEMIENCLECLWCTDSLSLFLMCYFNFQCSGNTLDVTYYEDIPPNTVHMAWQIPQYFLLTCAEVVFSVTGLEFSYSQVGFALQSSHCVKNPGTKEDLLCLTVFKWWFYSAALFEQ